MQKKTKTIFPKANRYKKKTKVKGFKRTARVLPKGSKKRYSKLPPLELARDKFGQFAGSRRKKK